MAEQRRMPGGTPHHAYDVNLIEEGNGDEEEEEQARAEEEDAQSYHSYDDVPSLPPLADGAEDDRWSCGLHISTDELAGTMGRHRLQPVSGVHVGDGDGGDDKQDSKAGAVSADDNPATAAADEAAALPATPLSVDAITGLIANADGRQQEQEHEPASQLQEQQQQQQVPPPPPPPPNPAAIVRSIASYLSFSDAESIGSLALSGTPYTPGGGLLLLSEHGEGVGVPSSLYRRPTSSAGGTPTAREWNDRRGGGGRGRRDGRGGPLSSTPSGGLSRRHDDEEDASSPAAASMASSSLGQDDADAAAGGTSRGGDGAGRTSRRSGAGTPWSSGSGASGGVGGRVAMAGRTPRGGLLRSRAGTAGSSSAGGEGGGSCSVSEGAVSWAADPPAPGLISLGEEDGEGGWDDDDDAGAEGNIVRDDGDDDVVIIKDDTAAGDEAAMDEESLSLYRRRHRQFVQRKLTAAVLSHPHSIRSYCLDAHRTALEMQRAREEKARAHADVVAAAEKSSQTPNELAERRHSPAAALERRRLKEQQQRVRIIRTVVSRILNNVPLSVLLDLAESIFETSLDTTLATFKLTALTIDGTVSVLAAAIGRSWEILVSFNPFALVGAILTLQRDAAYHATDALVSGIQSVATGVGSAGTAATAAAIHALSRGGGDGGGLLSGGGTAGKSGTRKAGGHTVGIAEQAQFGSASRFLSKMNLLRSANSASNNVISEKMYRKLSKIDSTSKVLSYVEREDEVLTQHAKKRVMRMMHYHVSLKPFVATVTAPAKKQVKPRQFQALQSDASFQSIDFPNSNPQMTRVHPPSPEQQQQQQQEGKRDAESSSLSSNDSEPFMCTPKSFPPTPTSRSHVMARGTRFAEDVIFLARDQLRVQGGLESDNAQTRAMAKALKEGSRLAVFNASDACGGIALTCGQHCATKVGNDLYCSTRSMIPILRNCYVYFEMSVSTPPAPSMMLQHASVSVGLSTLEMPLNTLVGAWKGSVGLCTTGQILAAGQWCSPLDTRLSAYGSNSTVGCLVCLDDDSAFETWDGVMVTAVVTFNVNGNVVTPPVCATPMGVAGGSGFAATTQSFVGAGATWDGQASGDVAGQQQIQSPPHASTMPLFVPREEELFPTLTLHSPETQVLCRFCAQDVLAKSRREIGAISGVTVFAVDGSVLLDEDDDELYQNDLEDQGTGSNDALGSLGADENLPSVQSAFVE